MRLIVTITVDADVDGWARNHRVNAATAFSEIRAYLRGLTPLQGQTYLTQVGSASVLLDPAVVFPAPPNDQPTAQ